MNMESKEIKLKQGIDNIEFGNSINKVVELWGKPSTAENIGEEIGESTTMLHYDEKDLTLFFEGEESEVLICIDINNPNTLLFGEEIIDKSSKFIIDLMAKNNIEDKEVEDEEWGERRVSFHEANIDFYFIDNELVSITYGK